ncbi:MAG: hypothetical protein Q7S58_05945 [Candidatus Binatus sp.]|uniref:STM4504/CBY_0614 family protein n=1 Tax=Candidatus Binatus sp. TaxID=2811406 RepID=UPI00272625D2|nr:hypothetical protein [Candidatus Binatus sp.]MDO8431938.1 hypothetical protein [Candidatus Binatus sp.]
MSVQDLFSRRKRRAEQAGQPEVYQYDALPNPLRIQIIHIWRAAIGRYANPDPYGWQPDPPNSNDLWHEIESVLSKEKGVFRLATGDNSLARCSNYLLDAPIEDALDVIELTFRIIWNFANLDDYKWQSEVRSRGLKQAPDDAISELNYRFREAQLGYQFDSGNIIRVDSQYLHSEAVKPALSLLADPRFKGPREEFLHAHELYRTAGKDEHQKREDAITGSLKAFESTLKVICGLKKWHCPANATAAPLIKTVIDNGLIPPFLQTSMEGLATLRNKIAAHGRGEQMRQVPSHLVAYALHLAASNIVMLVEAFNGVGRV